MTYCCAIRLDAGLVLCTDSRTNAGTDQVNTYSKMHRFVWPGNRVLPRGIRRAAPKEALT